MGYDNSHQMFAVIIVARIESNLIVIRFCVTWSSMKHDNDKCWKHIGFELLKYRETSAQEE